MNRLQKQQRVDRLREEIASAQGMIVASYVGLSVQETQQLRAEVRKAGASLRVVKNTLARLSLTGTDMEVVNDQLVGPTMLAFGEDPVAPAKALVGFAKDSKERLKIKAGVLGGKLLNEQEVVALSKLPSIDEMRAKLLGTFNAPAQKFVRMLNAPAQSFATVLKARMDKLEEEGA